MSFLAPELVEALLVDEEPFVIALLALAVLLVELLSDWSPVDALELLLSDWSPVVALVLLLSDWSPVVVVLSMLRLERPRRSIVGDTVEVDPVTDELVLAVEPVIAEFVLELDPVTDGLDDAVEFALVELAVALLAVLLLAVALLAEAEGVVAEFTPEALALACESGMQSMWTGLAEWSLALPVSLSASLPAWGWPSSLQSGLVAPAVVLLAALLFVEAELAVLLAAEFAELGVLVELIVEGWFAVVELVADLAFCAKAGLAARAAASASELRYWERSIVQVSCFIEG